jgi:hypothetical protein
MLRGRGLPGNLRPEVDVVPMGELRRRMQEETRLFASLFCRDRGDRLAGESPIPDPAACDACGRRARLGRLLESDFTLSWTVRPGPVVVACPVPAERPEDGQFWLCRACWTPP